MFYILVSFYVISVDMNLHRMSHYVELFCFLEILFVKRQCSKRNKV